MGQAIQPKRTEQYLEILRDLHHLEQLGVVDIGRDDSWVDKWIAYSIVKEQLKEASGARAQDD